MKALDNPLPCDKRAEFLATGLRGRLFQSLDYLLEIYKDELPNSVLKIQDLIRKLSSDASFKSSTLKLSIKPAHNKISGLFFALNTALIEVKGKTNSLENKSELQKITEIIDQIDFAPIDLHDFRFLNYKESKTNQNANALIKKFILFEPPPGIDVFEPSAEDSDKTKKLIQSALSLIKNSHLDFYKEMEYFISEFMILETQVIKGGSSFDLLGLVFFSVHCGFSRIQMAETLIHETAHLYLYNLGTEDALVLNHYDERYYSPIRRKERPMLGLYHAAFVLIRVMMYLTCLKDSEAINDEERLEVHSVLNKYQEIIKESLNTINRFGKLTMLGRNLINASEKVYHELLEMKEDALV